MICLTEPVEFHDYMIPASTLVPGKPAFYGHGKETINLKPLMSEGKVMLSSGRHPAPSCGVCLVEAINHVSDVHWTDVPIGLPVDLGLWLQRLNDMLQFKDRQLLTQLIPLLAKSFDMPNSAWFPAVRDYYSSHCTSYQSTLELYLDNQTGFRQFCYAFPSKEGYTGLVMWNVANNYHPATYGGSGVGLGVVDALVASITAWRAV